MAGKESKDDKSHTQTNSESQYDYENDCRTACKYGMNCYQKNPLHRKKFKHPLKRSSENEESSKVSVKKIKLNNDITKTKENSEKDDSKDVNPTSKDNDLTLEEPENPNLTPEEKIKKTFQLEMPQDFYSFWEFCQSVKTSTLKTYLNLILVGPFDILSGKLKTNLKKDVYLNHSRFYYDPPEFTTVIATTDKKSEFHFGYFRDDPKEMPNFVATNNSMNDCILTPIGPNLFAAVSNYIKIQMKDTKSKIHLEEMKGLRIKLEKWANENGFSLELKNNSMKTRQKLVVANTFHKVGIVVPVDTKTEVGYRPLPETDVKLRKLMQAVVDSENEDEKSRNFDKLHEIMTLIQFANDECDYGMGFEYGIDLFCFGDPIFHSMTLHLLTLAYDLLNRSHYAQIITAHLKNRNKNINN